MGTMDSHREVVLRHALAYEARSLALVSAG
jgi:hypothetical protein